MGVGIEVQHLPSILVTRLTMSQPPSEVGSICKHCLKAGECHDILRYHDGRPRMRRVVYVLSRVQ